MAVHDSRNDGGSGQRLECPLQAVYEVLTGPIPEPPSYPDSISLHEVVLPGFGPTPMVLSREGHDGPWQLAPDSGPLAAHYREIRGENQGQVLDLLAQRTTADFTVPKSASEGRFARLKNRRPQQSGTGSAIEQVPRPARPPLVPAEFGDVRAVFEHAHRVAQQLRSLQDPPALSQDSRQERRNLNQQMVDASAAVNVELSRQTIVEAMQGRRDFLPLDPDAVYFPAMSLLVLAAPRVLLRQVFQRIKGARPDLVNDWTWTRQLAVSMTTGCRVAAPELSAHDVTAHDIPNTAGEVELLTANIELHADLHRAWLQVQARAVAASRLLTSELVSEAERGRTSATAVLLDQLFEMSQALGQRGIEAEAFMNTLNRALSEASREGLSWRPTVAALHLAAKEYQHLNDALRPLAGSTGSNPPPGQYRRKARLDKP